MTPSGAVALQSRGEGVMAALAPSAESSRRRQEGGPARERPKPLRHGQSYDRRDPSAARILIEQ
jgi:hypothetical protein